MNNSRIVFGSGNRHGHHLVPEILEVGWGRFARADCGHLRPHAHTGAFEFCFILSGEVEWATAHSADVLRAGDIYVTRPGEVHWGLDEVMHPCTLHWLILGSVDAGFVWPNMDPELAAHLDAALRKLLTHHLRGNVTVRTAFEHIFEEHRIRANNPTALMLQQGSVRAVLQHLLIELIRIAQRQETQSERHDRLHDLPPLLRRAIQLLHANADDPHAVHKTCGVLAGNCKALNQDFGRYLGTTVTQFWLRERVRLARKRLRETNTTITQIASDLGFSSSQHFATSFRKITGLTPSEYLSGGAQDKRHNAHRDL